MCPRRQWPDHQSSVLLSSWKGFVAHKSGWRWLYVAGPTPGHRIVCCRVSCPLVYWQGTWKASAVPDGLGPSLVCTLRRASLFLHRSSWSTVHAALRTHSITDVQLYGHTVLWEITIMDTRGGSSLRAAWLQPSQKFSEKIKLIPEYFFFVEAVNSLKDYDWNHSK